MSHYPIRLSNDLPDQPLLMRVHEMQRKHVITMKSRYHADPRHDSKKEKVEHVRQRIFQRHKVDLFLIQERLQAPEGGNEMNKKA